MENIFFYSGSEQWFCYGALFLRNSMEWIDQPTSFFDRMDLNLNKNDYTNKELKGHFLS